MHGLSGKVRQVNGPEVNVLLCLYCGRRSVRAQTREETEWLKLAYVIPILRIRNVYARCNACQQEMLVHGALADVASLSPVTLQHHLAKSRSFVGRVCIILGVALGWAPFIGIIPAAIGICYRKQFGTAMRVASVIGLVLSLLTTAAGTIAFLASRQAHGP